VRLDLVGQDWPELVKIYASLDCLNRSPEEGGKGDPDQVRRVEELLRRLSGGPVL
jgi:hypothetical protein